MAMSEAMKQRKEAEVQMAARLFSEPMTPPKATSKAKKKAGPPPERVGFVDDDVGYAALMAVIAQDQAERRELTREQAACFRASKLSLMVADGKLLSSDEMSELLYAEDCWRDEAERALARMQGPVLGSEKQSVRLRYS